MGENGGAVEGVPNIGEGWLGELGGAWGNLGVPMGGYGEGFPNRRGWGGLGVPKLIVGEKGGGVGGHIWGFCVPQPHEPPIPPPWFPTPIQTPH